MIRFNEKYDLKFSVKRKYTEELKGILTDNKFDFIEYDTGFCGLFEFCVLSITIHQAEVIRVLLKKANIEYI